jgi:uncharacterized protein YqjF (DUF2071 family)
MPPIPAPTAIDCVASRRPWSWAQSWRDVLFAHWRVPADALARHIPPGIEPDLRDGAAWVSAVAFQLRTRRYDIPFGPAVSFPELNLRAYVRRDGQPAILFLSLHAFHRLGVALARWLTPLPYIYGRINCSRSGGQFRFALASPEFDADCRLSSGSRAVIAGSLNEWLLERYVGFAVDRCGHLFRMNVTHPPWQVRDGSLRIRTAGLGTLWGLDLSRPPDLWHFSDGVDARVGPFEAV